MPRQGDDETGVDRPSVSIIIPVYNAGPYLEAALVSTAHQGLDADQVEIIAVDDGSTDGSGDRLDAYARAHPGIQVIHQASSGGPGAPRNTGIEHAHGRYLFFLDADDELTPGALGDMVAMADRVGSEVVLGKVTALGGRSVRGAVYAATREDADLITDHVMETLAPWKLFSRELVDRLRLRFLTGLKVAEDQPFVARAYLNATRISICADREYYHLRAREDGGNATSTTRTPRQLVGVFAQLFTTIIENTDPGALRDAVMWRAMRWSIAKPLDRRFLRADDAERREVVCRIQEVLGPYVSEELLGHQGPMLRMKTELALAGEVDALEGLIAWSEDMSHPHYRCGADGFVFDVPPAVERTMDTHGIRRAATPRAACALEHVDVRGEEIVLTGHGGACECSTTPDAVTLVLHSRGTGREVRYPADVTREIVLAVGGSVRFRVQVPTQDLPEGIWDLSASLSFGSRELKGRLADSTSGAERGRHYLFDSAARGRATGVLYRTRGGNMSLDLGFHLTHNALPQGRVVGLLPASHGAVTALLAFAGGGDTRVAAEDASTGRLTALDIRALSADLVAVTVPRSPTPRAHELRLVLENAAGRSVAQIADSLDDSAFDEGNHGRLRRLIPRVQS